jgi:hypothetical protein
MFRVARTLRTKKMPNKLELARFANDTGRYREALRLLEEAITETNDLSSKISVAGAIYSTIISGICQGRHPFPATREYEDCRKYLKIRMDSYDQADPTIRAEVQAFEDVEKLKKILSQMERGEPILEEKSD